MILKTDKLIVDVDAKSGIGWLTFNQPERRNAISREMWLGISDVMQWFQERDEVRVVILRGAGGKAFASGADISEFEQHNANAEQSRVYMVTADKGMTSLSSFSKPLIAMIQGYCIGAGLGIALYADVRFATTGSRFAIPAAKLGLGYEYDGVARLARLVGPSVARDILFSARQLESAEAHAVGLVNFVESDEALENRVREYACTIARNAPLTVRASKAAINLYERTSQAEVSPDVKALISQCIDSSDYAEGRRAFVAKRAPDFTGC